MVQILNLISIPLSLTSLGMSAWALVTAAKLRASVNNDRIVIGERIGEIAECAEQLNKRTDRTREMVVDAVATSREALKKGNQHATDRGPRQQAAQSQPKTGQPAQQTQKPRQKPNAQKKREQNLTQGESVPQSSIVQEQEANH